MAQARWSDTAAAAVVADTDEDLVPPQGRILFETLPEKLYHFQQKIEKKLSQYLDINCKGCPRSLQVILP